MSPKFKVNQQVMDDRMMSFKILSIPVLKPIYYEVQGELGNIEWISESKLVPIEKKLHDLIVDEARVTDKVDIDHILSDVVSPGEIKNDNNLSLELKEKKDILDRSLIRLEEIKRKEKELEKEKNAIINKISAIQMELMMNEFEEKRGVRLS